MEIKEKKEFVKDFFERRLQTLEAEATSGLKTFKVKGKETFASLGLFLVLGTYLENFSYLNEGRKVSTNDSSKDIISSVKELFDSMLDLNVSFSDLHDLFQEYYYLFDSGLSGADSKATFVATKKKNFVERKEGLTINLKTLFQMTFDAISKSRDKILSSAHRTEEVYEIISKRD